MLDPGAGAGCRNLLQCGPKCRRRSRVTPSMLRVSLASTVSPATLIVTSTASRAHCDRTRIWVFSPEATIFDDLALVTSVGRCLGALSCGVDVPRVAVSSAYMYGEHHGTSRRGLTSGTAHNKNRDGDSTLPCGNPARNTLSPLTTPFSSTRTRRSLSHCSQIQETKQRGRPSSSSRSLSSSWSPRRRLWRSRRPPR